MINEVELIGRLGATPEIKEKVAKIRLCTTESRKLDSGEWESIPTWHSVKGFGDLIERMTVLNKGDLIRVKGSIHYNEFEGKWYTDIKARKINILKRQGEESAAPTAPEQADKAPVYESSDVNDDLPF